MAKKIRLITGRGCEVRERVTGPLGAGHGKVSRNWSVRSPKAYRLDNGREYKPTTPAAYRRDTTPSLGI
jgi:hypothetical protein